MPLPLLLVGDSPRRSTGLARIARDLMQHLVVDVQAGLLDLEVAQCGPDDGGGAWGPQWTEWPFYGLPIESHDWGARELKQIWTQLYGDREGIILTVWDAARCYALIAQGGIGSQVQWWGYFPVDAQCRRGGFGGPAAEAVRGYARVLGYGRWGSVVLKGVTGGTVPYLPHGLDTTLFESEGPAEPIDLSGFLGRRCTPDSILVGCVAANQPRKDLGLFCEALAQLKARNPRIHGWLHTDTLVGPGWAVQELVAQTGIGKYLSVTTSLTDWELAALYRRCSVTIAPGLGEGFGYPIAESLACGTPVVHGTYAGGAELVPKQEWRFPMRADRLEGIYALVRPVYRAEDVANAAERAITEGEADRGVMREYCAGAVAHLGWERLWPRWRSWVRAGIKEF